MEATMMRIKNGFLLVKTSEKGKQQISFAQNAEDLSVQVRSMCDPDYIILEEQKEETEPIKEEEPEEEFDL